MSVATRTARAVVVLALAIGCASVPGSRSPYRVAYATPRGPYLDARLEWTAEGPARFSSDAAMSFLFPDSDACRRVLEGEAVVEYAPTGLLGTVHRGDETCRAVGISVLREWRDRKPRGALPKQTIPRAQASYRVAYRDDRLALLLGRFPLLWHVGWTSGDRVLVLLARTPDCETLVRDGAASIEFRPAGPNPLSLVAPNGLCAVEGLVLPDSF